MYVYLVHVWFHQHLSYQGLSISSLVYGGIRSQAVTHHVHIGCLQTLDQQALQRLLQHGGDPCDTLSHTQLKNKYWKHFQQSLLYKKHIKESWINVELGSHIFEGLSCILSADGSIDNFFFQ